MGRAYDYDLGVIGGGAAGLSVTAGAARLGVKTLLVEREPALGGDCLHYGCVPSKALIRIARLRHDMSRASEFGLAPLEVPPVDFRRVRERIRQVIATIQVHDSPERFRALGATTLFGEARFVSDHEIELDGKRLSAARWVVATGSRAAVPDAPGLAEAGFLTNREIFSLESLPGSLIILGGGAVAVEMAQAFRRLGAAVHVVQRGPQILSREDRDMADAVKDALAGEGVRFHLNARIARVAAEGGRKVVDIEQEGAARRLSGSDLLVALGRAPNVEDLDLAAAGVEYGPGGIVVDGRLRTSRKHIFAAGDVLGRHLFTHAAGYEAGVVVANAVFRLPRRVAYSRLPWCAYCEPEFGGIGLSERQARERGLKVEVHVESFADNDRAQAEGLTSGRLKLVLDSRGRPLGVRILGPSAGELLGEWAAVLAGRLSLARLAGLIHPYPTLAEISKRAAGAVVGKTLFSDRVRKILAFAFHYRGRAEGPDRQTA